MKGSKCLGGNLWPGVRERVLGYGIVLNTKIENVFSPKDTIKRMERQPIEWKDVFENQVFDKGPVSRICKELSKLNSR